MKKAKKIVALTAASAVMFSLNCTNLMGSGASRVGDINGDNIVNAVDASKILIQYAQLSTSQSSVSVSQYDTNGDGMVTASDASLVLSYYADTVDGFEGEIPDYINYINKQSDSFSIKDFIDLAVECQDSAISSHKSDKKYYEICYSFDKELVEKMDCIDLSTREAPDRPDGGAWSASYKFKKALPVSEIEGVYVDSIDIEVNESILRTLIYFTDGHKPEYCEAIKQFFEDEYNMSFKEKTSNGIIEKYRGEAELLNYHNINWIYYPGNYYNGWFTVGIDLYDVFPD